MNKTQLFILFIAVILLISWCIKESFTSPGTMDQLASTRAPEMMGYF